jgi:hypothetical protein
VTPRQLRWVLIVVGGLALARGGASIFSRPEQEVLHSAYTLPPTCLSSGCITIYTLTVGNTGSEDQEQVRVRLHAAALQTAILPLTVRTFGKVERPFALSEEAGVRTYALGRLRPGDRVELSFALRTASPAAAPPWDAILAGVEPAHGTARAGDPAAVSLGRLLYAVFGVRWW